MGQFDSFNDGPLQIRTEGQTIDITFDRLSPTTGRISWTLPEPQSGCASDQDGVYCGIVVTIDNTPIGRGADSNSKRPVDGTIYTADPTGDTDLHVGSKIGTSLVIGAFYEAEQKGTDEPFTTTFDITGLSSDVPYYVQGFATTCEFQYHQGGVHAYSLLYADPDRPDSPSMQNISFGKEVIVDGSDLTGLLAGNLYTFDLLYNDDGGAILAGQTFPITINGLNAQTYDELITDINKQFALLDNPNQSPVPPNTGRYFWDATSDMLFQWNGSEHVKIENVIVQDEDPTTVVLGTWWLQPSTGELRRWNLPAPSGWNLVTNVITFTHDPVNPESGDFWFDGTVAWERVGPTWCSTKTFNTAVDPTTCPTIKRDTWWFDETNMILNEWDVCELRWVEREAIFWPERLDMLSDGTFWFDTTNNMLFERDTGTWDQLAVTISDTEPVVTTPGQYWFDCAASELFQRNGADDGWIEHPVIVWPTDPSDIESCSLWWDSTDDMLKKWDAVHGEWDPVCLFIQSPTDPQLELIPDKGDTWWNPDTSDLKKWDGSNWIDTIFVSWPTDPTEVADGTVWHEPEADKWFERVTGTWVEFMPVVSEFDPNALPNGTFWFDSDDMLLFERQGTSWIATPFTTMPLTPAIGEQWFDTSIDILMEWDGVAWVLSTQVLAVATLGSCLRAIQDVSVFIDLFFFPAGRVDSAACTDQDATIESCIIISSTVTGSLVCVEVDADTETLFSALVPQPRISPSNRGSDGKDGIPTWAKLGCGTDGSVDERRELMDSIRAQLGHPVVKVELTQFQLDTAVTAGLESLRKRSSVAYRRAFFFLDIMPGQQRYHMTDRAIGFDCIVNISAAYRFTSAFLSSAHGSGVFGQVVLQHLYNMGTFDLSSFHLVAQYVEQMEHLFATRLTYHWDEPTRNLDFYNVFVRPERVLLDTTTERTEQELLKDRWCKTWIEKYALAEARLMLSEIRGKYASLPGAGGGVALNASELIARHDQDKQELYQQIDDFLVNDIEDLGMHSTFIIG